MVTGAVGHSRFNKNKKYSKWGLNPRPSACKADVITTTLFERVINSYGISLCKMAWWCGVGGGMFLSEFKKLKF